MALTTAERLGLARRVRDHRIERPDEPEAYLRSLEVMSDAKLDAEIKVLQEQVDKQAAEQERAQAAAKKKAQAEHDARVKSRREQERKRIASEVARQLEERDANEPGKVEKSST